VEEGLRAVYMGFSAIVFALGFILLLVWQNSFDAAYRELLEAINGGYIW